MFVTSCATEHVLRLLIRSEDDEFDFPSFRFKVDQKPSTKGTRLDRVIRAGRFPSLGEMAFSSMSVPSTYTVKSW